VVPTDSPAWDAIDIGLVRRLVAMQFPQWASLPIEQVDSVGFDNAIFRLGSELAIRIPRRPMGARQVEKEHRWLPLLAPALPLPVPVPLGKGRPAEGYPWAWTVCPWLTGEIAAIEPPADAERAALDLAEFMTALHTVAPPEGPRTMWRGVSLAKRDEFTRTAIATLRGPIDVETVTAAWDEVVGVPEWSGPDVWLHGDLHPANVLVCGGRLSAVIDFGHLAVGDPAADLMGGWMFFGTEVRRVLRDAAGVDDATWDRGRGWALSTGLACLALAPENPVLAAIGRRALDEVSADLGFDAWRP
jgi:aminoglycoside phosphotransferase (APT) family kinase protein